MPTATLYFVELPLVPFPLAWGTHSQWLVDTGYKGLPLYLKVGPPVWCDFHSRAYMGSGWSWALPETMFLHTDPPPTHHFLLPLYPFSLEHSLHTSLSQKTSIPIPAQDLPLGNPSLIHGENGTGKAWWQGNNLGGFCNNSVKKYWFFSFLPWNSMTLDRILPVVIASSLALFYMLEQTQVKLAHEAV